MFCESPDPAALLAEICALVPNDNRPHDPGDDNDRGVAQNQPVVRVTNTMIISLLSGGAESMEVYTGSHPSARLVTGDSYDSIVLPDHVYSKVVARLKRMSKLNLRRRGRNQQGVIEVLYNREDWQVSVTVTPFQDGERVIVTARREATGTP